MSWTADNSGRLEVAGNKVSYVAENKGDQKANAMWSDSGNGYWEFEVSGSKPGVWLGVSSQSRFGEGYSMKGLFFGGPGNLSDGGSLVTGQWGPRIELGDRIGMRVENGADGNTTVAYSRNGSGLGVAFSMANAASENFQPAVSMNAQGQAVSITSGSMPSMDAMQAPGARPSGELAGKWDGPKCKAVLMPESGNKWRLSCQVGNTMNCEIGLDAGGNVTEMGTIMSTKMMPPPEMQATEREVKELMEGLARVAREGDSLVLEAKDGKKEVLSPAAGAGPATRDQIHWLNK